MNYSYKIHVGINKNKTLFIVEFINKNSTKYWQMSWLQESILLLPFAYQNKKDTDSFIRTKEWTLNNHPELLL
jgi:hypothetical protein